jgi:DNA-binding transcriptional ArsR family regulator
MAGQYVNVDSHSSYDPPIPLVAALPTLGLMTAVRSRGGPSRTGGGLQAAGSVNDVVNDPFRALSHPIRRGIVERLASGPATVGEATAGFGVSKPAISKHLKVLEETGVVTRAVEGRTHRLSLRQDALSEAADWMDHQRALWGRMFDAVDEYLKTTGGPPPAAMTTPDAASSAGRLGTPREERAS